MQQQQQQQWDSISEVELIRGQHTNNVLSDGYLHPQEATWDGGGA